MGLGEKCQKKSGAHFFFMWPLLVNVPNNKNPFFDNNCHLKVLHGQFGSPIYVKSTKGFPIRISLPLFVFLIFLRIFFIHIFHLILFLPDKKFLICFPKVVKSFRNETYPKRTRRIECTNNSFAKLYKCVLFDCDCRTPEGLYSSGLRSLASALVHDVAIS